MRQYPAVVLLVIAASLAAQSAPARSLAVWNAEAGVRPVEMPQPAPPTGVDSALKQMADEAAIIFVGEVKNIRRSKDGVEITWDIDEAVRGVAAGAPFVQREWAGLWADGTPRYQVGQHALVMLHKPSVAGFSSPVTGQDGVLPVHGNAITGTVDLRWVVAHIVRAEKSLHGKVASLSPMQSSALFRSAPDSASQETSVQDVRKVDRSIVMGMLRTFAERAQ